MTLTPRDVNLLAHVTRHRMLSSDQLALLDGGNTQNLRSNEVLRRRDPDRHQLVGDQVDLD
jgi:hypothetical protein